MIHEREPYSLLGSSAVGGSFGEVCSRAAAIAERASRAFRTLPAMRQFQLHLAAALHQASLRPANGAEEIRQACEAFLVSTEHYLDEVEGQGKPPNVLRLKSRP